MDVHRARWARVALLVDTQTKIGDALNLLSLLTSQPRPRIATFDRSSGACKNAVTASYRLLLDP